MEKNLSVGNSRYSVSVALIYKNRIYICKRDCSEENYPSTWQFVNGHLLDDLENPIDAAVRIIEDTTGLELNPKRLRYIGPIFDDPLSETCYVYCIELFQGEYPQQKHPLKSGPWYLFNLELAQKFNLMTGLHRVFNNLRVLFE